MWALSREGTVPRQHVWGIDALAEHGHAVDFAPFHEPAEKNVLSQLTTRSRNLLGHLDQEAYAMRRLRGFDVLYCADQSGLAGLALARRVLPPVRLISVVHHPVHNPLRQRAAARHDALICLSARLSAELRHDLGDASTTIVHLPWGPDLSCALYAADGERNGVVSAGKSNRDLLTISAALKRTGARAVVYDLERQIDAPPNPEVRLVRAGGTEGSDPDAPGQYLATTVISDIAAAAIVAVPVLDAGRLTGLTEVVDALALGKPILATRSPYFPFDIEAVGCGIWIDPADVDGWCRAIAMLMADDNTRLEMGAAGRRFAEREWNYQQFCDGLLTLVEA